MIQASEDSEKIDDGINEETYEKTKKYLKIVFEETQQQENISNSEVDEEITKELEKIDKLWKGVLLKKKIKTISEVQI